MNKKEYYFIICSFIPYYCEPIEASIVISEGVATFIKRQKENIDDEEVFNIKQYGKINKEFYDTIKN